MLVFLTLPFLYCLKDEKLQDVLGHFQKDFEGGVSAENLGKLKLGKMKWNILAMLIWITSLDDLEFAIIGRVKIRWVWFIFTDLSAVSSCT